MSRPQESLPIGQLLQAPLSLQVAKSKEPQEEYEEFFRLSKKKNVLIVIAQLYLLNPFEVVFIPNAEHNKFHKNQFLLKFKIVD